MNYTKKVLEHFKKPKHVGKIKNPSGVGEVGNIRCGDQMKLFIKVEDNIIKDIKFKTFGCAAAIASSDILCDIVIGKTIEQAKKLTKDDVVKELGDLPPVKLHCSLLAIDALKKAIKDYENTVVSDK